MSKATVKITTTRTRSSKSSSKPSTATKGNSGQKRCPTCGRYR